MGNKKNKAPVPLTKFEGITMERIIKYEKKYEEI